MVPDLWRLATGTIGPPVDRLRAPRHQAPAIAPHLLLLKDREMSLNTAAHLARQPATPADPQDVTDAEQQALQALGYQE